MYIYLASPYSSPDPLIRKTRFLLAEQVTAAMLTRREWVYSPIVHCHELAMRHELPGAFAFWKDYNFAMLQQATALIVLAIPGWKESRGTQAEIGLWKSFGFEPRFVNEDADYIFEEEALEIG